MAAKTKTDKTINCHDVECEKKATGAWLDTETLGVADFCDDCGELASTVFGMNGFVRVGEPGTRMPGGA